MSSYKGVFTFKHDNIRQTVLSPNVNLRLERLNGGVATLSFVNDNHAQIPIPPNFVVLDLATGAAVGPLAQTNMYALAWTDDYQITFNGGNVLRLSNRRRWVLRGDPERRVLDQDTMESSK